MSLFYDDKSKLVKKVFNDVYDRYDLMNDIMSFGIHRIWKKNLISWVNPKVNHNIVDVASGTGDIANLCSKFTKNKCRISCVEPNNNMLLTGKKKLSNLKNLTWILSSAENLPFKDNTFDCYIISFGIRNVTNFRKSLSEAYRVLKKGGRFFCLEFSKINNDYLNLFYQNYSRLIPVMGEFIVGDKKPYEYLIKSIKEFVDQDSLIDLMRKNKFEKCEYINLNGGIVALHSGWKI